MRPKCRIILEGVVSTNPPKDGLLFVTPAFPPRSWFRRDLHGDLHGRAWRSWRSAGL